MNTQQAYDEWSKQYDTNANKTRDLEGKALQNILVNINFDYCLEIGCGTGKNTAWLLKKAKGITAVDLSAEMLARAKAKIQSPLVDFKQADILKDWDFADKKYDLVCFSLVLEHIENLESIFDKAAQTIAPGGYIYIGELHPFKQYTGTRARFETDAGTLIVNCFDHHISDFIGAAQKNGFTLEELYEYFDDDNRSSIPRIINFLFKNITG